MSIAIGIIAAFLLMLFFIGLFSKGSKSEKNPDEHLENVSDKNTANMRKLTITKLPDNAFCISGVQFDSLQGFLVSMGQVLTHQYQSEVLKGEVSDAEFHLICLKAGNHLDSVVVNVSDEGFVVATQKSVVNLAEVFENIRFNGEYFAVKCGCSEKQKVPQIAGLFYSHLSVSIGFKFAALLAGRIPKNIPMNMTDPKESGMEL